MTRRLLFAGLLFALLTSLPQPVAQAGGALIETTAPLSDRSEAAVKAAVIAAIDKAVRGAAAMGFAWFQLRDAQLSEDEVSVQILATDENPDGADQAAPDERPSAKNDRSLTGKSEDEDLTEKPSFEFPIAAPSRLHI
jgi:hypothetical protein